MVVAAAAIGAVAYTGFANSPEPLALILREIGQPWAARMLGASAVIALPTVILAFFYGQSRIFFTVARDGLLPTSLARVSSRGTPVRITIFTAIVTSVFAGLIPLTAIAALANAGTLAAFVAVCAAMLVLRRREPDARAQVPRAGRGARRRSFGILGCLYLFISLPNRTQLFFVAAQVIGLVLYAIYGSGAAAAGARRAACLRRPRRHRAAASRNIVGGSAGNLVEWFDWYVYSAFALYFAPVFFPKGDATAQLLNTAAIFAVGFVMRPVGAWAMGIYADHKGRKAGLMLSVSLMCVGSLMIAVAPSYASAGVLVAGDPGARADHPGPQPRRRIWLERDLSVRNGRPRAARLLVELPICDDHRRPADRARAAGRAAGDARRSRDAGTGAGASASPPARVLAIVVYFIRRRLDETLSYENVAAKPDAPALDARQPVPRPSARGTAGHGADRRRHRGLLRLHHLPAEVPRQHQRLRPRDRVADHDRRADHHAVHPAARRPHFRPHRTQADDDLLRRRRDAVHLPDLRRARADARASLTAFALVMAALVIVTGYTSINAIIKAEMFPADIRALGVALPYAIANAIFGGTAEYVAL